MAGSETGSGRGVPADPPYEREQAYAARYRERRFQTGTGPRTHRREVQVVADLVARSGAGPGPWLDVPAGTGRMSPLLPSPVIQVDRDAAMLRAGNGSARVGASILALPFPDDCFAGALCHRLLQHFPQPSQRIAALTELARVTAGPIVFSYFDATTLQHARRRLRSLFGGRRSGRSAVRWCTLRGELETAGLRAIARRPLHAFLSEQTLVLAARR